ncbi:triacylglycerol lipase [Ceratobasidium sp. AG-Ba]|nr:triacylglycerol lipase [Ceratobasidium sp. AG-Ba]
MIRSRMTRRARTVGERHSGVYLGTGLMRRGLDPACAKPSRNLEAIFSSIPNESTQLSHGPIETKHVGPHDQALSIKSKFATPTASCDGRLYHPRPNCPVVTNASLPGAMTVSTCAPSPILSIYRRVISIVSAGSQSAGGNVGFAQRRRLLWPRWRWQGVAQDTIRWPRWLSMSAANVARPNQERAPQKTKRRPDLNSTIYKLMNCPALFDPVRAPRNKIVLCHGLYGFDVRGPSAFPRLQLHYWSNVLDILKGKVGADVVVTGVPGTGSIQDRATLMHNVLSERVRGQSINFVAHSMGGLDCRHLISRIQPSEYDPVSLTTISTPHRGSSFMDWCAANIGIGELGEAVEEAAKYVPPYTLNAPLLSKPKDRSDAAQSLLAQLATLPQSLTTMLLALLDSPAYANLTTHFCSTFFNPQTPNMPGVKYYSVAARAPADMSIFHPLWLPKTILDAAEAKHAGRTPEWGSEEARDRPRWHGHDGLVSVASARWGEFLGVIEGVDHWELRGAGSARVQAGWTEWAKSFGIWRDERAKETVVQSTEENQQRAAATAALDWVVNAVSSSHAANPGGEQDPAEQRRRKGEEKLWDLERFYVALCRKLYEDGL